MTREEYKTIETFMLGHMKDSAHDRNHIYRVLNAALDIAAHTEETIDMDVLLASALLHDIGREKQFADLELDHAQIGGEMALEYLSALNWQEQKAKHVRDCIVTHRYRNDNKPETIEARIIFDADKLDACGALGLARTFIYEGKVSEPLYILGEDGEIVADGGGAEISSFFQEYNYKLKNIYDVFYTPRAKEIALERQKAAVDFYNNLYGEITHNYESGLELLDKALEA